MKPKSWMTKTGGVLLTVAGITGSLSQVLPIPAAVPWLTAAAILIGAIGMALTGQGIRRRLPTIKEIQGI